MGRFIYDTYGVDLDDRTLEHLRLVVMTKLRRGESFMLDLPLSDGSGGRRSFWLSPASRLQFRFLQSRHPTINRAWAERMIVAASGPNGLTIPREPDPHSLLDEVEAYDRIDA